MSHEMSRERTTRRRAGVWTALLCLASTLLVTAWTTAPRAAPGPPAPAEPVPAVGSSWPVGLRPLVVRAWEPPPTPYARGHRGVDLSAPAGSPVRTVAAGRVSFAGRVAGRGVVTIELTGTGDPPLRTTYEPVLTSVKKGDEVTAGALLGTLEATPSHCPTACLHWGLRRGETYLDPLSLLPPWLLRRGPSRLLPVRSVAPPPRPRAVVPPERHGWAQPGPGRRR
ncbi:M23 family metallopeptidase [Streptomyces europaeiscabiei]|uniref:M23 family metallopeptidase n=1 Tax=Streptomyces europaeiscabiei TaxID=146819 RepID=UPI0029B07F9E|nr:M23 family metallopeptidase [Streptomyces europaeiscabiei]MDX3634993.1 M23 family metallopeptidase [Streptomyces europaeiscabiei]MDX3651675.1 M23 family metallopeptidase [Streptomyces europaeiscabiei]